MQPLLLYTRTWLTTVLRKSLLEFPFSLHLFDKSRHTFSYGIDAELKNKRDASLDPKLEAEAREWIGAVGGTPIGPDLAASLNDGVLL